ncbi:MAG: sugar transferase [Gordonibacter sp.]
MTKSSYRFLKRTFDIFFSTSALIALAVPSILLCIAIRIESPGAPLYRQTRVGIQGRLFTMYKFRSMVAGSDNQLGSLLPLNEVDGPLFKIKQDPRVTRIGRFIRKYSIDEIPQFANVLIGNMTLVGPRPALPREVAQYDTKSIKRLCVKPGLTGYWQISGRNMLSFEDSIDLDLRYIAECCISADLKTLAKTLPAVLSGRGAH